MLSYRRAELARLRGSVRAELERCISAGQVTPMLSTLIVSIDEHHVVLDTASGREQVRNDHVIVQIGGQPPSDLLRTIGIQLVEKRGEA